MMNLSRLCRCTRLLGTLMLCVISLKAAAATTYVVTANITAGACTVSVDTPQMSSVDLAKLANGGLYSVVPVSVNLIDCGGSSDGGAPTLSVKGATVKTTDNPDGDYLFADSSSTLSPLDVGFVLSDSGNPPTVWDGSKLLKNNSNLSLGQAGQNYTGGTKKLFVGVGCGSNSSCQSSAGSHPNDSGVLNASIQFVFSYK